MNWRGKFIVTYSLESHHVGVDFDAALFADDAAVLHALVFAAVALVVLYRTEYLGAEQAVALGLERAVVDGLRLFHFTVGPFPDLFGRGYGDLNGFQVFYIGDSGGRTPDCKEIVQSHAGTCRYIVKCSTWPEFRPTNRGRCSGPKQSWPVRRTGPLPGRAGYRSSSSAKSSTTEATSFRISARSSSSESSSSARASSRASLASRRATRSATGSLKLSIASLCT